MIPELLTPLGAEQAARYIMDDCFWGSSGTEFRSFTATLPL
ncbi:MAG TPA: hypothetical protein VKZ53_20890 [Candidatus Angelobacter sp.]|nr:hypothetical protein [Candidatus Angelobacter sp.]